MALPNNSMANESWLQITDSLLNDYYNKWICDELWYRIMCSHFPHFSGAFPFERSTFVRGISRMVGGFDNPNANGVYHKAFKSICPYDGSRRTVHYFYRHKVGPPQNDLCNAPSCAYYEQKFAQKYRPEEKEDRNHAHLQSANKKSDCEIIERGAITLLKMMFLTTDQSSGIPR